MTDDGFPQITMAGTDPNLPPVADNSFAKYSNFRELDHGGKAKIHACFDNMLGRAVAVKSLAPEIAESEYERRRFLREARVTAQLQHPNTPPIYEVGRKDDGGLYFSMKLLAGQNLYRIIQQLANRDPQAEQHYSPDVLMEIVIQTCQALAYAHAHGVIHRDIKPENVWVGRFGEVLVLDWGVAKVWGLPDEPDPESDSIDSQSTTENQKPNGEDEDSNNETPDSSAENGDKSNADSDDGAKQLNSLTQSGKRPGTPLYMSPEQVSGQRYIDERTDIFSVGVMMYELLTLKLPFHGANIQATFERIMNSVPKRPTHAAPFRNIPESLETVILTALEKEPGKRFQTMPELIHAIRTAKRDLC